MSALREVSGRDESPGGAGRSMAAQLAQPSEEVAPRTAERSSSAQVRTFRVFVSSTFTDFMAERDVLRERVWPRLRAFCVERGARFQEVDLRWGISKEAAVGQLTMSICLEEIKRCHETTPRPNFLVLVGNRIGWKPVPPQIPVHEWELIHAALGHQGRTLLDKWYSLDENVVPARYRLRPSVSPSADEDAWPHAEAGLHRALAAAAAGLGLTEERQRAYLASATEQEIAAGAFEAERPNQVICFIREIEGYPDPRACGPDAPVRRWVDPDQSPLAGIKQRLRERLAARPESPDGAHRPKRGLLLEETVGWAGDRPAIDEVYLDRFAEGVFEALKATIGEELDSPLPRPAEPGSEDAFLDSEGRAHRAFRYERLAFLTSRDRELDEAARYLRGSDRWPLLLHGEGGMGKSVLMAAVARDASRHLPGCVIVERYVGATPASSDAQTMLRGICCELACRAGEPETQVPGGYADLVVDFAYRLGRATARPIVVLVDSLDQLSAFEPVRGLSWIPAQLPEHARLVVSTRPGRTLSSLQKRAVLLEVGGLPRKDAERLLDSWLADVGHTLQPRQRGHVIGAFERSAENPLYLRLAFEAARRWPSAGGRPPERLAVGLSDLIRVNLFGRLERKDQHGEIIVSRALGYLAASRYGLAEDELVDLLSRDVDVYEWFLDQTFHVPSDLHGLDPTRRIETLRADPVRRPELRALLGELLSRSDGPRLPAVLWSRLLSDLRPYLTAWRSEGTEVLAFHHHELQGIAEQVYATDEVGQAMHTRLADYFEHNLGDVALLAAAYALARLAAGPAAADLPLRSRALAELPWQLAEAGAWDRLHTLLADETYLGMLWLRAHYEVREFWSRLADKSAHRLDETYAAVIDDPAAHLPVMNAVYELMTSRGGYEAALIRMNQAVQRTQDGYPRMLARARQAEASINAGDYDDALRLARAVEREARKHGIDTLEANAVYLQAQVAFQRGECEKALAAITRAEAIARRLGNKAQINLYLKWKATILKKMGRLQESMELYPHLERWYIENNDTDGLAACVFEAATLAFASGDFDTAFARLERTVELVEEMGSRRWLLQLYITSAIMYSLAELHAQAVVNFEKYQILCRELGQDDALKPHEAAEYAAALVGTGRDEDALKICERYEPLARGPIGRDVCALRILLEAHMKAISDLRPIWRTYLKGVAYLGQEHRLHKEYEALEEEYRRVLSDPANALAVQVGRQIQAKTVARRIQAETE